VTVVALVLADDHDIRFGKLAQRGYAGLGLVLADGEFGMDDLGWAGEPWVEEDGEGLRGLAWRRRKRGDRLEGQKEARVRVEVLHREGHPGRVGGFVGLVGGDVLDVYGIEKTESI